MKDNNALAKNTTINLLYVSGNNDKVGLEVVVKGAMNEQHLEQICGNLRDGISFIAHQVGLPTPSESAGYQLGYLDHAFTTIAEIYYSKEGTEGVDINSMHTDKSPTMDISIDELVQRIANASWDVDAEMLRLGLDFKKDSETSERFEDTFERLANIIYNEDLKNDTWEEFGEDSDNYYLVERSKECHEDNYRQGLSVLFRHDDWRLKQLDRLMSLCESNALLQRVDSSVFDALLFSDRDVFTERTDGYAAVQEFYVGDYIEKAPIMLDKDFFESTDDDQLIIIMKTLNEYPWYKDAIDGKNITTGAHLAKFCNSVQHLENNHLWHFNRDVEFSFRNHSFGDKQKEIDYLLADNFLDITHEKQKVHENKLKDRVVSKIYLDVVTQLRAENPKLTIKEIATPIELYGVCKEINMDGTWAFQKIEDKYAAAFSITGKGRYGNDFTSCVFIETGDGDQFNLNKFHYFNEARNEKEATKEHTAVGEKLFDKINELGEDVFKARQAARKVIHYKSAEYSDFAL
jgi:hypothetical protein